MRLKSVKLTHFRGYRDTTVIPIDEAMTGIVGRNDYGKSTILEALAIGRSIRDLQVVLRACGEEQYEQRGEA